MCTVTVVPVGGGFRLGCNRDELFARPPALPPRARPFGWLEGAMPVDPVSGGSWIGVNEAGLAIALLNGSPPGGEGIVSRGRVVPRLLGSATVDEAVAGLVARVRPDEHAPFRLVITDGHDIVEARSDGTHLTGSRGRLGSRPRLFTSSGLGDGLVEPPRRRLFEAMFEVDPADWPRRQDLFHRHSWSDRRHLSVCMRREEAATVSHTLIESLQGAVRVTYFPGPPDAAALPVRMSLPAGRREAATLPHAV